MMDTSYTHMLRYVSCRFTIIDLNEVKKDKDLLFALSLTVYIIYLLIYLFYFLFSFKYRLGHF